MLACTAPLVRRSILLLALFGVCSVSAQTTIHRINAGGSSFTDSRGQIWSADELFSSGNTYSVPSAIVNTDSDRLYQTERWWPATTGIVPAYAILVPAPGEYQIRFHFAETYSRTKTVGARVFDVLVENAVVLNNLDIFSEAGGDNALVKTVSIRTADQTLNIAFQAVVQNPKVNAIEIIQPAAAAPATQQSASLSGELKVWHNVTLTLDGPATSESGTPNPFLDYRMNVTFTKGGTSVVVPGYYAADGNADDTSATAGNKWRVHFVPQEAGTWSYRVSFRSGANVAVAESATAGTPITPDGASGTFSVVASDKPPTDLRSKGFLRYVGQRYFRYSGSGEYFLKGGANSPENLLAFADFDGTTPKHHYSPHAGDWRTGDPTWKNGKGKNLIGALNYLAAKKMNAVYFLTMNVGGDGNDVWPWTSQDIWTRFDVSKLGQWEIALAHMEKRGMMLHVVLQEQENDQLLNGGTLGRERMLYYRELVARFGHHLALVWNLGEESTNTDAQRKAFASYIRNLDPYNHPVVVHTFPTQHELVYTPLLGSTLVEGASLQVGRPADVYNFTSHWIVKSKAAGQPWVVSLDEIGPSSIGVAPDSSDPYHDGDREAVLWGNLMAGGAGVEWYFGYSYPHHDLTAEDWRSRDKVWDMTGHALGFFRENVPLPDSQICTSLVSGSGVRCLGKAGEVYVVDLPNGGAANLNLNGYSGTFAVKWFNPRQGGTLQNGTVLSVPGTGIHSIGLPPTQQSSHWVALVKRSSSTPSTPTAVVRSLTLINADTGAPVAGFESITGSVVIALSALPPRLTLRANTYPTTVGSVRFGVNEQASFRVESVAPYILSGDTDGICNPWWIPPGTYTLMATPYSGPSGSGTPGSSLTLQVTVK